MAKDFKASQVRTSQIIASNATLTQPSLFILSSSSDFDGNGSTVLSTAADIGRDVFLVVSGAKGGKDKQVQGVSLFLGDVVVSGTLYAEKQVIEVDVTTTGSVLISGSLIVSQSATIKEGLTVNASQETGTENDFTVYAGSVQAIFVDASQNTANAIKLQTNGGTLESIKLINSQGTGADAIAVTATAGGIDIDAAATKDIDISGGQVSISSKDNASLAIALTTNVGASETIRIKNQQGTGGSAISLEADAGGINVDTASSFTIDAGTTYNIAAQAGNSNISTVNGNLTLAALTDGTVVLNAASTSDNSKGVIEFQRNAVKYLSLSSSFVNSSVRLATMKLGTDPGAFAFTSLTGDNFEGGQKFLGSDIFFVVSGAVGSKDGATRGVALFGGDVVISGTLHGGSPLKVGNSLLLTGALYLQEQISVPDVTSNESVIYAYDDAGIAKLYWKNGDNAPQQIGTGGGATSGTFNEPSPAAFVTTASLSIAGAQGFNYTANTVGSDVIFYVSGSSNSKGGAVPGVAAFGGDVIISGSLYGDDNILFITSSVAALATDRTGLLLRQRNVDANITLSGSLNDPGLFGDSITRPYITTETTNQNIAFVLKGGTNTRVEFIPDDNISVKAFISGSGYISGTAVQALALSGSLTKLADGTSYLIAGTNVTITTGSNGAVTIESTGGGGGGGATYFSSTTNGSIFTTGSAAFAGADAIDSPTDKGSDVIFYVSGSSNSKGGAIPGTAVFGGDIVISGTLFGGSSAFDPTTTNLGLSASKITLGSGSPGFSAYSQDITVFMSGSVGAKGVSSSGGTTVIGGDAVISGSLFVEKSITPTIVNPTTNSLGSFPNTTGYITSSLSLGNIFRIALADNTGSFLAPINARDGQQATWIVKQSAFGSSIGVWAAGAGGFAWPGGVAPVLSTSASAIDMVTAQYDGNANRWLATFAKGFV